MTKRLRRKDSLTQWQGEEIKLSAYSRPEARPKIGAIDLVLDELGKTAGAPKVVASIKDRLKDPEGALDKLVKCAQKLRPIGVDWHAIAYEDDKG